MSSSSSAPVLESSDIERFFVNVWGTHLALGPETIPTANRAKALKDMIGFLEKFATTLAKGSPELICVHAHRFTLKQLLTQPSIQLSDLRHVGQSLLDHICFDMLIEDEDDEDYSDDEEFDGDIRFGANTGLAPDSSENDE